MKAIIISDLHIGSAYFQRRDFEGFLHQLAEDRTLILNGDIVDCPYEAMQKADQQVIDRLQQISQQQPVVWIRGNHDNGYLAKILGAAEVTRSYSIGNRLFITHGDDFDHIMPRSRFFIKAFKWMHAMRVRLGARPVHVAQYAKKWAALYRVLRKNVMLNAVDCAAENGFDAVVCGHTHFAEDLVFEGIRYINTGAWTEAPMYFLQVTPDSLELKKAESAF
jgi:UDP-2,3-diacylglucosamine pyrophosphatase LpxH